MKKRTVIIILGFWIALVPFLGLPASWKSKIIIISGLVVAALALTKKSVSADANVPVVSPRSAAHNKPRKPREAKVPAAAVSASAPAPVILSGSPDTAPDTAPEKSPGELPIGAPRASENMPETLPPKIEKTLEINEQEEK